MISSTKGEGIDISVKNTFHDGLLCWKTGGMNAYITNISIGVSENEKKKTYSNPWFHRIDRNADIGCGAGTGRYLCNGTGGRK